WDAGWGVKSLAALAEVVSFFEERRGRLHGFRWRDRLDFSSSRHGARVTAADQVLGAGDGERAVFGLVKAYGIDDPYLRPIAKPVVGSVRVAVDGGEITSGFSVDHATGAVAFDEAPGAGLTVT